MSPEARREAVRLMLLTFQETDERDRFDWDEGGDDPREEMQSHRALKSALARLDSALPKRAALIRGYMQGGHWHDERPGFYAAIDETIDWLAQRMPDPIVIPDGTRWEHAWTGVDDVDELGAGVAPRPSESIVHEILAEWRAADRGHVRAETDWSMPALHPGEDRAGPDLAARYGEGAPTYHIDSKRAPSGLPPGRPRRGSKDPVRVTRQLLELCPDRTIEQVRSSLGRGRKTAEQQQIRAEAIAAITSLHDARKATPQAIADALGIDVSSVHRLVRSQLPQNPD